MDQRVNSNGNNGFPVQADARLQQRMRQEEELDLREIISLLLHHAWVIALAALAGALLIGLGVKLFVPAKYKSTAIDIFSISSESLYLSLASPALFNIPLSPDII